MIYKRRNRKFWVQRGFASLLDGFITLITLGYYDGGYTIGLAEKTIRYHMEKRKNASSISKKF